MCLMDGEPLSQYDTLGNKIKKIFVISILSAVLINILVIVGSTYIPIISNLTLILAQHPILVVIVGSFIASVIARLKIKGWYPGKIMYGIITFLLTGFFSLILLVIIGLGGIY